MQHCRIGYLLVADDLILPLFGNFLVFHQHVLSGDSYVAEDQVSVVFCVEAEFRANVAYLHSADRFMLAITHLHHKRMHPIALAFDYQLSENACVSGKDSQIANPPLGSFDVRSVHYEGICSLVEDGCSHEPFNV